MSTPEQRQLTTDAAELYERYPARYILGPWAFCFSTPLVWQRASVC
jgi:hypothetical protein